MRVIGNRTINALLFKADYVTLIRDVLVELSLILRKRGLIMYGGQFTSTLFLNPVSLNEIIYLI